MSNSSGKRNIIIAALYWLFTWNWKKARQIDDAANKMWTGSTDGIAAAFDIETDKRVVEFRKYRDAVAQIEAQAEQKRQRLHDLNEEEKKLISQRDGALAFAEKAKAASDTAAYDKHAAAYESFDTRIQEIEAKQKTLETEVKGLEEAMEKHMLGLTNLQREIEKLPQEKADALADFVSANQIIALNDRLLNLQTSFDSGPIDLVRKANRDLTAKAKISDKLAGTDSKLQDQQYATEGAKATARDRLEQQIAAHAAEKAQKSGVKNDKTNDREKI
jgi:hypothetical protein